SRWLAPARQWTCGTSRRLENGGKPIFRTLRRRGRPTRQPGTSARAAVRPKRWVRGQVGLRHCAKRDDAEFDLERRFLFGFRVALPSLDEDGPWQAFLTYLPDMSFLKLLKLKIEVRLSDQLPFPLYVVLFIVDGLLIEPLVITI